jgi:hypothetical protein
MRGVTTKCRESIKRNRELDRDQDEMMVKNLCVGVVVTAIFSLPDLNPVLSFFGIQSTAKLNRIPHIR